MAGLWREVLSALTSTSLPDSEREDLLALGAAELACARTPGGSPAVIDVQNIAYEEFSLLLDDRAARAALAQRRK